MTTNSRDSFSQFAGGFGAYDAAKMSPHGAKSARS